MAAEHAANYGVRFEVVRRAADTWLPIHGWTVEQVWARIAVAGTRVHPAYAAGMARLSCVFCVLGSRADLVTAARLNPELAARFVAAEERTGHDFSQGLPMRDVVRLAVAEESATGDQADEVTSDSAGCPMVLALFAEPQRVPGRGRRARAA